MNSQIIVGEIFFNNNIHLFLYLDLNTQEIRDYKLTLGDDILQNSDNNRLIGDQKRTLESILQTFKKLLTLEAIQTDSRPLRRWRKTLPEKFKRMPKEKGSQNTEFQQFLFESNYFRDEIQFILTTVILKYDQTLQNTQKESGELIQADISLNQNISSMKEVPQNIFNILTSDLEVSQKVAQILSIIIEKQDNSHQINQTMKQGFSGLALQNVQLREDIQTLQQQLKILNDELSNRKRQEQLILEKRQRRKNRKRQTKREPITLEIYQFLIDEANALNYANSFRGARLRLAIALLLLTGVRISELLPLKIRQVKTLSQKSWIAIDRAKNEPPKHKAFLTK